MSATCGHLLPTAGDVKVTAVWGFWLAPHCFVAPRWRAPAVAQQCAELSILPACAPSSLWSLWSQLPDGWPCVP